MAGNSQRKGAMRKDGTKKGMTVGSGGQRRKAQVARLDPAARQQLLQDIRGWIATPDTDAQGGRQ